MTLIVLATSTQGLAGQVEVAPQPVPILFLRTDQDVYPLSPFLEILADPEKKLTIGEVFSSRYAEAFRPVEQKTLNLGLSKSSYWLRFRIATHDSRLDNNNRTNSLEKWVLDLGVPFGSIFCRFYSPVPVRLEDPAGLTEEKGFFVQRAVEPSQLEPNQPHCRLMVFALPPPSGTTQTFFLKIEGERSLYLPLNVTTRQAYLHTARNKMYLFGICLGIILGLMAYNLSMYFILRDNAYIFFVFKMTAMALVNTGVVAGLTFEWFPFTERHFLSRLNFSFGIMAGVTSAIFVISFFMTQRYHPIINRVLNTLIAIQLVILAIVFMVPLQDLATIDIPISLVQNVVIFILILAGLRRGFWPARYYLAGFIILTAGLWSFWLIYAGILPYYRYGVVLIQIGSICEAIFFTLAVFNRLMYLRYEKEEAEHQARREELAKLHYQIRPHFLLNSLNSIYGAMLTHQPGAREMVANLAEFFRLTLQQGRVGATTVGSELEMIKRYIEIEQARYGEGYLEFGVQQDPEVADVAIPPFLLQPLVENAIKFGSRSSPEVLKIKVTAQSRGPNHLYLEVANTGTWIEPDTFGESPSTRIGLDNLWQRLSKVFSSNFHYVITKEHGWVTVGIEFPVGPAVAAPM